MSDLYINPVFYGIQDVIMEDGRGARIMYPTDENYVFEAPLRDGGYPLIVFAHGSREGGDDVRLCPQDDSQDYKRWTSVLHLLARCGFVVVAPDVHRELPQPANAAAVLEETARWMRREWDGRDVLHRPFEFSDPDVRRSRLEESDDDLRIQLAGLGSGIDFDSGLHPGNPTPLGVIGHSWGARAAAIFAAGPTTRVGAYAAIAGAFDANEVMTALESIRSTLLVSGQLDGQNATYLTPLWHQMPRPKNQALLAGAHHWSWFSPEGGVHPCNGVEDPRVCPAAWRILAELLVTFMARCLLNFWTLPPSLLGATGGRPPLPTNEMWLDERYALKVRWDDPQAVPPTGQHTYGFWTQDW